MKAMQNLVSISSLILTTLASFSVAASEKDANPPTIVSFTEIQSPAAQTGWSWQGNQRLQKFWSINNFAGKRDGLENDSAMVAKLNASKEIRLAVSENKTGAITGLSFACQDGTQVNQSLESTFYFKTDLSLIGVDAGHAYRRMIAVPIPANCTLASLESIRIEGYTLLTEEGFVAVGAGAVLLTTAFVAPMLNIGVFGAGAWIAKAVGAIAVVAPFFDSSRVRIDLLVQD